MVLYEESSLVWRVYEGGEVGPRGERYKLVGEFDKNGQLTSSSSSSQQAPQAAVAAGQTTSAQGSAPPQGAPPAPDPGKEIGKLFNGMLNKLIKQ